MRPPASAAGTSRTSTAPGPKRLDDEAELGERLGRAERGGPPDRVEIDDLRNQQDLARDAAARRARLQALVDEALMRGVLVDDDDAVGVCATM